MSRLRANQAISASQDFIISTLKANALGALAAGVAPLLGPNTAIVFAQNGLPWWYDIGLDHSPPVPPDLSRLDPCGALREAIEPVRVIGAVIHSSNEVVAPGIVVNDSPLRNTIVIGEPNNVDSTRVRDLRAAFAASEIKSPPVDGHSSGHLAQARDQHDGLGPVPSHRPQSHRRPRR